MVKVVQINRVNNEWNRWTPEWSRHPEVRVECVVEFVEDWEWLLVLGRVRERKRVWKGYPTGEWEVLFLCVVDCDGWVCCVEEIEVIGMCLWMLCECLERYEWLVKVVQINRMNNEWNRWTPEWSRMCDMYRRHLEVREECFVLRREWCCCRVCAKDFWDGDVGVDGIVLAVYVEIDVIGME